MVLIPLRQGRSFRPNFTRENKLRIRLNPFETGQVFSTAEGV